MVRFIDDCTGGDTRIFQVQIPTRWILLLVLAKFLHEFEDVLARLGADLGTLPRYLGLEKVT